MIDLHHLHYQRNRIHKQQYHLKNNLPCHNILTLVQLSIHSLQKKKKKKKNILESFQKLDTIEEKLLKSSGQNNQTCIKDISITYEHMRTSFDTTCQDMKMKQCVQDLIIHSNLNYNIISKMNVTM